MVKYAVELDVNGYIKNCWYGADHHNIPKGMVAITQAESEIVKGKKVHPGSEIKKYKQVAGSIIEEADPRKIGTWSPEEVEMDVGDPSTSVQLTLSNKYTGSDYEIIDSHHRTYTPTFTDGVATLTFLADVPGELEFEKSNDISFTNKLKVKVKGEDEITMPEE